MKNTNIHLFLVFCVALVVRSVILFQSPETLLVRWGSDDLFYYTQIAGNVAYANGFTFDGIHATNGFQWGFLLCLIPFGQWLLNDLSSSLYISFSLITVLTFFGARVWFLAIKKAQNTLAAFVFLLLMLLHPKWLNITFQGTEAALVFLSLGVLFLGVVQQKKGIIILGSCLAVLSRFDMAFVVLAVGGWQFYTSNYNWKKVLIYTPSVMVVFALLLANNAVTGNYLPDSAQAKSVHASVSEVPVFWYLVKAISIPFMAEAKWSLVSFFLSILLGYQWTTKKVESQEMGPFVVLSVAGVFLLLLAIVGTHGYREWYAVPLFVGVFSMFSTTLALRKNAVPIAAVFLIFWWAEAAIQPRKTDLSNQLQVLTEMQKRVPTDQVIGAFNAGMPAAVLGASHSVVNLDGVVNHEAFEALKNHEIAQFVSSRIDYVLDIDGSIQFFIQNFSGRNRLHLELVEEYRQTINSSKKVDYVLYRVIKDEKSRD